MMFKHVMRLLAAGGMLCAAASASTIFNFDSDALGTSTAFTDTVNGLAASFSSDGDPGGFVVYPSMFETLTGNVLGDPGPAGLNNLTLAVNFSQELTAVTFNFATADFETPSPLTLAAYQGSNLVGSVTTAGSFLSGFTFPEGEAAFAGGRFDELMISSSAPDFAVDNITVTASPEPSIFALVAVGLIALGACRVRRRNAL